MITVLDSSDSEDDVPILSRGRRNIPSLSEEAETVDQTVNNVYTSRFLKYREMRSKMTEAPVYLRGKGGADVYEEEKDSIFGKCHKKNNLSKSTIDGDIQEIHSLNTCTKSPLLLEDDVLPIVTRISPQATSLLKNFDEVAKLLRVSGCEELNTSDSFADDCVCLDDPLAGIRDITVKIRWRTDIIKLQMKNNENFRTIFPAVAEQIGASVPDLILSLDDVTIKSSDTPQSINLSTVNILDCFIINKNLAENESIVDGNTIELKLQSENRWKKVMRIHVDSPMKTLIEACALERAVDPSKVVFYFDGEAIIPSQSPSDLDLETGLCIDVRFLS